MAERKIKLTIAYDGSGYHGWQRQKREIVTVQQVMEGAIGRVVNHPVELRGSGRTDTAVHAAGQVATFRSSTPIPSERLHHAINTRLPRDIRVRKATDVGDDFDAIGSSKSKLYRYTIFNYDKLPPVSAKYCYHYYHSCELEPMQEAAEYLVGKHDFASFASAGHGRESTVRTLKRCAVWKKFHWIYFDLEANGFLYHMVRNMVGTLLEVGRGYWQPRAVEEILAARDRSAAGPMAPAHGLSLQWVRY
ncbi:MAG: tRNA pseudouridine(38-40) synthase TruA [Sedimentisphaerales bacterium]|nr:tRNA pseudouridine(38-40) synthase TruA [Sedimentisphaerales bacterium]